MTPTALELVENEDLTNAARSAIWGAWSERSQQLSKLRRRRDYANGRAGIPDVDDSASEELQDLAKISKLGMCGVVVKTFARGLSVVGFRSPDESDDEPAWQWWQQHRLDARQAQVHRMAPTYGYCYVSVLPDDRVGDPARPVIWSPLSAQVEYDEPDDIFPQRAVLMRNTAEGRSVLLVDATTVTPGIIRRGSDDDSRAERIEGSRFGDIEITGEPWEHGATFHGEPVCPVVQFVDETSDEGHSARGVVEPLIDLNRAMNQVNFDRLTVARYGAHDQKLIIGWTAPKDRLAKLSAAHIGAIDEHPDDVRVDRWQASPLTPYNELIREMREQVALEGAIPLWAAGSISNVSTDTAAMIEQAHQRELQIKRDSYGESWELVIHLGVVMSGIPEPSPEAETIWRETQARAFGAVVDGITKLASIPADAGGVPLEEMLDLIPGMTQQRIMAIRNAIRRRRSRAALAGLSAAFGGQGQGQEQPPEAEVEQ